MRLRDIIGLVIALLLAVGVALLTRIFLTKEEKPKHQEAAQRQIEVMRILVASRLLHEGTKIQPGDLIWQDWPKYAVNPSYIKEGTVKIESFAGSIVRDHLDRGEPVTSADIISPHEKSALAAIVAPGKRAISIDVTAQSASSGLIAPGDYVDVIVSKAVSPTGGGQVGQSQTVLKNVKVLAIDIDTASYRDKPKNTPHVATIEVTPTEAERVTAASKEGTLSLSLHSLDTGVAQETQETGACEGENCQIPAKQKTVILMRGKDRTEIQVQGE